MTALVALGSNLGDRAAVLAAALRGLAALAAGGEVRSSHLYETRPWGIEDQPWFLNSVASFQTDLDPPALLAALQRLECDAGRAEGPRWGPRILDLDILDVDGVIRNADPILPHPRIAERAFVLVPLCEIAPGWVHPLTGKTAVEMLQDLDPEPDDCLLAGSAPVLEGEGEHGPRSHVPGD